MAKIHAVSEGASAPAVEAVGLVKRFGTTEALRGVDLSVDRATVVGLLGPNGAGKTTAVRILTTLLKPDAGQAFIDGIDVVKNPRRARARIGLTGQYAAVDERLTGFENLEHVGRLFHQSRREARARAGELLERFDLSAAADRVASTYSGGMRRRLDIAMSLIGRPSVLFLDEPTTGLDPRSRNATWDLIDELVGSGMTTLLTTQYLEEADRLAHEIAVIDHGEVIERGTPGELKRRVGGEQIEVVVSHATDAPTRDRGAGAVRLRRGARRPRRSPRRDPGARRPGASCRAPCASSTTPASTWTTSASATRPSTTCSSRSPDVPPR